MITRLETWWNVGVHSFAADNGYDIAEVPRELIGYVTASVTDIKALDEAEGWAYDGGLTRLQVSGDRVHMALGFRLEAEREAWAAVRGLDPRGPVRLDFAEHIARELIGLPSVCETDAVMTARYTAGRRLTSRTWTWQDRHPDARDDGPPIRLPAGPAGRRTHDGHPGRRAHPRRQRERHRETSAPPTTSPASPSLHRRSTMAQKERPTIRVGQIYRSLKRSDRGWRIRIVQVGSTMARAVDATNGRPLLNEVMLHCLHSTETTSNGKPRSRGYVLEQS